MANTAGITGHSDRIWIDMATMQLAPYTGGGGLAFAAARLARQVAKVGGRVRMIAAADGPDRSGPIEARWPEAWGETVATGRHGHGVDAVVGLTRGTLRTLRAAPAQLLVAHDHEGAAAGVAARRAGLTERLFVWLHSIYDTPHPSELPADLRMGLRGDSVVASVCDAADRIITSRGVLRDADEVAWHPRLRPMQDALRAGMARGASRTVEADGCLAPIDGALAGDPAVQSEPAEGPMRVLFPSRASVGKGLGLFLAVAQRLAGPAVEFVCVGDRDASGAARYAPGADAVRWTGWLAPEPFRRLLGSADLVLLPSITEGFGLSAVEADRLGRPMLYHDIGGLRSVAFGAGAHSMELTPGERAALYHLWGELVGADIQRGWAAWGRAVDGEGPHAPLTGLVDRWVERTAAAVTSHQRTGDRGPERGRSAPSESWGAALMRWAAERP